MYRADTSKQVIEHFWGIIDQKKEVARTVLDGIFQLFLTMTNDGNTNTTGASGESFSIAPAESDCKITGILFRIVSNSDYGRKLCLVNFKFILKKGKANQRLKILSLIYAHPKGMKSLVPLIYRQIKSLSSKRIPRSGKKGTKRGGIFTEVENGGSYAITILAKFGGLAIRVLPAVKKRTELYCKLIQSGEH